MRRGYGALMTAYGAPCPLALNTEVTLIDHSGPRVRIETSRGTLTASKVIVTVPTNLIADEAIRFHPALPAKVEAARGLPLGVDDKVMLALEDAEALPKDGNLRGATMRTAMGSFHLRPFGQPCIEGFFGGTFARELEDAGDGAFAAESIDQIVALLGSDFRRKLKPLAESRWAHDRSRAAPIPTRSPATPATARCSQPRSMGGCSLPGRRRRRIFSRPRMGRGIRGRGRRGRSLQRSSCEFLLDHPRPKRFIRHKTRLILPENPVAIARDEIVDRVAPCFRHRAQHAHPSPARQMRQHRQRRVGFEIGDAAMHHRVGVGIFGVDAETPAPAGGRSRTGSR